MRLLHPISTYNAFLASLIVMAALAAYHDSFSGPFVFDGESAITQNHTLRSLWPITVPLQPPSDGSPVAGRPITNLSFAFNYAFSGLNVRSYHVVNLAIHIGGALLLFGCVRRTLLAPNARARITALPELRAALVAAGSALLWTVHPLQTESVTYVAQRAESLMGFFFLLTFSTLIRGVAAKQTSHYIAYLSISAVACCFGMATKEVMATCPLLVLLYDRTFVTGSFVEAWRRRAPYYCALGCSWFGLLFLMFRSGNRAGTVGFDTSISWEGYATNQGPAIIHYLRLVAWPDPLVIDYGATWAWPVVSRAAGCISVALLVAGTIWAVLYRPAFGFVGAWFFAILLPTSSIIPVATEIVSEHRMYLPLAALTVLICCGLNRWGAKPGVSLAVALAAGLVLRTARRNEDYQSNLALWRQTAEQVPFNAGARNNYGQALAETGDTTGALRELEAAIALYPMVPGIFANRGMVLANAGRLEDAVCSYKSALAIDQSSEYVHTNLARALLRLSRNEEAVAEFRSAVRLNPNSAERHNELGLALEKSQGLTQAEPEFCMAVRLEPDYVEARYNWGNALAQEGRLAEAVVQYRAALRLMPQHVNAQTNLGAALLQMQRFDEAIDQLSAALRIDFKSVEARMNLGSALAMLNRPTEASVQYEAALLLDPENDAAHFNLAVVLSRLGKTQAAETHFAAAKRLRGGR